MVRNIDAILKLESSCTKSPAFNGDHTTRACSSESRTLECKSWEPCLLVLWFGCCSEVLQLSVVLMVHNAMHGGQCCIKYGVRSCAAMDLTSRNVIRRLNHLSCHPPPQHATRHSQPQAPTSFSIISTHPSLSTILIGAIIFIHPHPVIDIQFLRNMSNALSYSNHGFANTAAA